MQTKKKFASSSKNSKKATDRSKRSRIASEIISGLKEAVAFSRGEIALPVRVARVLESVDIRVLRSNLRMSQSEFANQYGFSTRTIQQWEQGRSRPDIAARAYLTVIQRNPRGVIDALAGIDRRER